MSEIRQRKLKDDSAPAAAAPRARSLAQPRRLRKVFVVLIIAAVCATYFTGLFAGQSRLLDGLARSLGYRHEHHYAVLEEPPRGSVAAMSFFYDVAADAGLIDVMRGGKVTIGKYKHAAQQACGGANIEQPWACMDLVYIVTLLNDAYKMSLNHPISLYKKVNGHEVSWALGLAYTTIMNRINVK